MEMIRTQVGIPNLEVKVISRSIWRMSRQVADVSQGQRLSGRRRRAPLSAERRLRHELAASRTHTTSPGSWPCLQRPGRRRLLDSYDVERRPIAQSNADFSLRQPQALPDRRTRRCAPATPTNRLLDPRLRQPSAQHRPVARLPLRGRRRGPGRHRGQPCSRAGTSLPTPGGALPALLDRPARTHSTLDWFDRGLVLVAGPKADGWIEAARNVRASRQVAIVPPARCGKRVTTASGSACAARCWCGPTATSPGACRGRRSIRSPSSARCRTILCAGLRRHRRPPCRSRATATTPLHAPCTPDELPRWSTSTSQRDAPAARAHGRTIPRPAHWLYANGQPIVHLYAHRSTARATARRRPVALDHISFPPRGLAETRAHLKAQGVRFDEAPLPGSDIHQIFLTRPAGPEDRADLRCGRREEDARCGSHQAARRVA